jgi:hypothetical protein
LNQPLKAHGYQFDAPINAVAFAAGGAIAFGLGDGGIHIDDGAVRKTVKAQSGAVPALKAYEDGFLSLSDAGTLKIVAVSGTVADFADFKGAWTERMDVHANGSVAVAVGKEVHLWTKRGAAPKILGPHGGSVSDVCFTADGLGLAASHRDGVTLWAWPHFEPQALPLPWKGAHLAVTISTDKRWIVTAMQEGALHVWNLALKRDYQMRGYWTKPTKMAWSADRRWLATSGSETVIIWPFDKSGPEGREPLQLGWSNTALVSALAAHPSEPVIAAGFEDGAVLLLDLKEKKAFSISQPSGHAVSALAFDADGNRLAAGTVSGGGAVIDFA